MFKTGNLYGDNKATSDKKKKKKAIDTSAMTHLTRLTDGVTWNAADMTYFLGLINKDRENWKQINTKKTYHHLWRDHGLKQTSERTAVSK